MGYVIYHKESTRTVGKTYKTHSAAKAQITRMSKRWFDERYIALYPEVGRAEDPLFIYGIAERSYFEDHIEQQVERTNLMTGQKYMEPVNRPNYMSPASETYWSM